VEGLTEDTKTVFRMPTSPRGWVLSKPAHHNSPAASRDYSGTLTVDAEIEVFQLQRAARGVASLCKVSRSSAKVDFNLADDVWKIVVPTKCRDEVVCSECFGSFACERRIELFQLHESPVPRKARTCGLSVGRVLGICDSPSASSSKLLGLCWRHSAWTKVIPFRATADLHAIPPYHWFFLPDL